MIVKVPEVLNPQHLVVLNTGDAFTEETRRFLEKLSRVNKSYTRLINRVSTDNIQRLNSMMKEAGSTKIDLMLPEDPVVFKSIAARESAYAMNPGSKFCVAIRKVAEYYKSLEFGKENQSTFNVLKTLFSQ
jgi:hypothetical protein